MSFECSPLEDVAEIIDSLHKTPDYSDAGFPMVRVTDVKYGTLNLSNTFLVNEATYGEFSRRYKPSADDIIITRVGTYGVTARVTETTFCLGQNTAAIVPKSINSRYLYAALNSEFVRRQIEAGVVGSTQKTLSLKHIKALSIPRLGNSAEAQIAETVGSLDDRISLLRETNTTLESIAQALFKSWFVDFDPVRAKQQGNAPQGMYAATVALFPDSFEESELGEVPKGWRVLPVGDAVEAVGGATPDTKNPIYWESGTFCWTTPKDLSGIAAPVLLDTERKLSAQGIAKIGSGLLPVGTLLLSSRAPIGYLALAQVPLASIKATSPCCQAGYIGIATELKQALKEYTASKGRGRPTVDVHEAFAVLLEKMDVLHAMLHGFDYSGFLTHGHSLLAKTANHVLGIKDGKKRFDDTALAMSKAFTLCCTLDEAKAVREEVAFFQSIKVMLTKKDASSERKINEERDLAIRQIISSAVVSEDVVDIFNAVGLDKPNIGILDDDFLNDVRNLPERNLAVELLERLLEGEIKTRFATNVIQNNKFSELLANVIKRYQNRSIETAQVMEELIAMAKKFKEAADRGTELGLNDDELAFYDALANNEASVRELGDETLKKIAHELTEALRKNISVDWAKRDSVRASLRLMVKRILRKYKYPPVKTEEVVELVLSQAEKLCEEWA